MAKVVILFVVLMMTLQGSYQKSQGSSRLNDFEEATEELILSYNHANGIISYVGTHLSAVTRNYEHRIDDTLKERTIIDLVKKHSEAIDHISSEISADPNNCINGAWSKTMLANGELFKEIDTCVSIARYVAAEMQSILEAIDGKATKIENELTEGISSCVWQSDEEKFVKCLRDLNEPIKEKLTTLDQQVKDTRLLVIVKAEDGIKNLNTCLQKAEQDYSAKSEFILKDLDICVQNGASFLSKYTPKGIMDVIRELKEKIEYIMHILSHLPSSIAEIPDKISDIISHLNIAVLMSQIKEEIDDIINDGGSNAESCRPMADERTDAIVAASEATANQCLEEAEDKVDEIQANISALTDEAKQILSDIKNQTVQCFLENKLNPVEFYKCLEGHVDEFQQRAADLQQNVTDTYENAKVQADEIIKSLATCVNKVQIDTINQGQVLIKDVENCVRHSYPMFFMK